MCKKSDGGQGQSQRGRGQHVVRARSKTRREWHNDGASAAYRRKRAVPAVGLQRKHTEPQDKLEAQFEHLSFASLTTNSTTIDTRDEVFAYLDIRLPKIHKRQTADLRVKVDTGAQCNILPLRVLKNMFPDAITGQHPTPGTLTPRENTIISAYNGTRISQYGTIKLACRYHQSDRVDADLFVADPEGPAILGLPNSRQLRLVTLHCAIEKKTISQQADPIGSTQVLKQTYPDRFDTLGNFPGTYHIMADPDVQPVIHAPRKCPIQLKEELQKALDKMVQDKSSSESPNQQSGSQPSHKEMPPQDTDT